MCFFGMFDVLTPHLRYPLKVVVAGLLKNSDDEILIAERLGDRGQVLGWEFPGGKVESGESEKEALSRELWEELGLKCVIGEYFETSMISGGKHDFPLKVYWVSSWSGKLHPVVHGEVRFVPISELPHYKFLPADIPIIQKLYKTVT